MDLDYFLHMLRRLAAFSYFGSLRWCVRSASESERVKSDSQADQSAEEGEPWSPIAMVDEEGSELGSPVDGGLEIEALPGLVVVARREGRTKNASRHRATVSIHGRLQRIRPIEESAHNRNLRPLKGFASGTRGSYRLGVSDKDLEAATEYDSRRPATGPAAMLAVPTPDGKRTVRWAEGTKAPDDGTTERRSPKRIRSSSPAVSRSPGRTRQRRKHVLVEDMYTRPLEEEKRRGK